MRHFGNKTTAIWLMGLLPAALVWLLAVLPSQPLAPLNTLVFDTYQRIAPRDWAGSDVVIVDIDEASIKRIGQWPWPRTVIAQMTERLAELGAAAIGFDIVFSEEDRTSPLKAVDRLREAGVRIDISGKTDIFDNDEILAKAFRDHMVVTGLVITPKGTEDLPDPKAGTGVGGTVPSHLMKDGLKAVRNLPLLDEAAAGIGDFSLDREDQTDAVIRSVRLLRGVNGRWYPSLSMELLRVVQGAGGFKLRFSDASGEISGSETQMVSAQVGAIEIPVDAEGAVTIHHSPVEQKPLVAAADVLFGSEDIKDEIANHIVLVGTSAPGLLDLRATPLDPVVPGVTVHAEIIDQIIAGDFLTRPDYAPGLELTWAIAGVLLLLIGVTFASTLVDAVIAAALVMVTIIACWLAFSEQRLLFSPVVPVLSIAFAYAAALAVDLLFTERESEFVRDAFGHYLAPAMVERLAQDHETLTLGGEDKELTILFCDIRGFTSISEGLDPTELTELLNDFLTPMTDALLKRGATIDKYMGDAIMAFWNAPIDQPDHRVLACKSVVDMRRELRKINRTAKRPIEIGIGLNTGPCCVGNLGSSQRFNYSAIGDAVNVSSRIEGLTKTYGLDNLVAEETLDGAEGVVAIEVDLVAVVGREVPLSVHMILGRDKRLSGERVEEYLETHARMIDAYRAADHETGLAAMALAARMAERLSLPSMTRLYALYAQRFGELRENGVPASWDGVYRPTSK